MSSHAVFYGHMVDTDEACGQDPWKASTYCQRPKLVNENFLASQIRWVTNLPSACSFVWELVKGSIETYSEIDNARWSYQVSMLGLEEEIRTPVTRTRPRVLIMP